MRARDAAGYAHADNLIDTAEQVRNDQLEPQQARATINAFKWAAAVLMCAMSKPLH